MSAWQILWIDNDRAYIRPHVKALEAEGYQVTILDTVSEATNLLTESDYDLVILDVMIPMSELDEADGYSPELTDCGHKTGLAFYIRNRDSMIERHIPVMVVTIRIDQSVVDEFIAAGLPQRCFVNKYSVRDPWSLVEKVRLAIVDG